MPFSLFALAERIERHQANQRSKRAMTDVQADPHLARDIGLPYRPREPRRLDQW